MTLDHASLASFTGSQSYTYGPFRKFVMTDGVEYLCNNGLAWFVDIIASHQTPELQKRSDGFQEWRLLPSFAHDALIECVDGNYKKLCEQPIEYTDFSFERFPKGLRVWVERGSIDGTNMVWVAMLPTEH